MVKDSGSHRIIYLRILNGVYQGIIVNKPFSTRNKKYM